MHQLIESQGNVSHVELGLLTDAHRNIAYYREMAQDITDYLLHVARIQNIASLPTFGVRRDEILGESN